MRALRRHLPVVVVPVGICVYIRDIRPLSPMPSLLLSAPLVLAVRLLEETADLVMLQKALQSSELRVGVVVR